MHVSPILQSSTSKKKNVKIVSLNRIKCFRSIFCISQSPLVNNIVLVFHPISIGFFGTKKEDVLYEIGRMNDDKNCLYLSGDGKWQRICVKTFNDISFTAPHIDFASLFFPCACLVVQRGTIKSKLKSKILMQTISSFQRARKKKEITIDARRKLNGTSSDCFLRFGEIVIMILELSKRRTHNRI